MGACLHANPVGDVKPFACKHACMVSRRGCGLCVLRDACCSRRAAFKRQKKTGQKAGSNEEIQFRIQSCQPLTLPEQTQSLEALVTPTQL